jgi:signal transduction histidine kinase
MPAHLFGQAHGEQHHLQPYQQCNKIRATDRQPVIEVTTYEDDKFYILEVKDNGLGLDIKQNQDSLFKLYKRFHFHTDGKGLGLYLVKLQCESLGGSIRVESEINRYAKFQRSQFKTR